jgi:hypothetical protein
MDNKAFFSKNLHVKSARLQPKACDCPCINHSESKGSDQSQTGDMNQIQRKVLSLGKEERGSGQWKIPDIYYGKLGTACPCQ